jgi:hypothetical protein
MTTLQQIAAETAALPEVETAKIWQDRRVYVSIVGRNSSFAGDRNASVYYDGKAQKWRIDGLKGTMSSEFKANIRKFAETRCREAFWRD